MALMLLGLTATVTAVWLSTPSLALFILGGAVTGAGVGAIFKGAVGTVIRISPPERRAEALTGLYLANFLGLSAPVVRAGIALAEGVSPRVTLLGFAIASRDWDRRLRDQAAPPPAQGRFRGGPPPTRDEPAVSADRKHPHPGAA